MVNETNNNELDEAISAAIPQSQKRFDELVAKYAGKVIIVLSGWRAEDEHVEEVNKVAAMQEWVNKVAAMQEWGGVYHFPAWHEFSTASGDGIATLFSEKPIPYNVAEELVDLWYNQGLWTCGTTKVLNLKKSGTTKVLNLKKILKKILKMKEG